MHIAYGTLGVVVKELLRSYHKRMENINASEIEDIVTVHALGAAASSLAAGWLPGAGGTAAILASAGFIWSMYYRINNKIGIKLSKNIIKSLGSAVLTNIVTQVCGVILGTVASTILSFIPGIGSLAASLIMAGIMFSTTVVAGIIYLKMLTAFCKEGKSENINSMSEEELKKVAKTATESTDLNAVIKEAKKSYIKAKKSGAVTGNEKVDLGEFGDDQIGKEANNE